MPKLITNPSGFIIDDVVPYWKAGFSKTSLWRWGSQAAGAIDVELLALSQSYEAFLAYLEPLFLKPNGIHGGSGGGKAFRKEADHILKEIEEADFYWEAIVEWQGAAMQSERLKSRSMEEVKHELKSFGFYDEEMYVRFTMAMSMTFDEILHSELDAKRVILKKGYSELYKLNPEEADIFYQDQKIKLDELAVEIEERIQNHDG